MTVQVKINEPCHEHWDSMTPQEKGRFCASCSKTVYDVTDWSDEDLTQTYQALNQNMCIRIPRDRIVVPRINRYKSMLMAGLTFVAALWMTLKSTVAKGQVNQTPANLNVLKNAAHKLDTMELSGTISDTSTAASPVAFATVVVRNNGRILKGTMTNSKGEFSLIFNDLDSSDTLELTIDAIGHKAQKHLVNVRRAADVDVYLREETATHNHQANLRVIPVDSIKTPRYEYILGRASVHRPIVRPPRIVRQFKILNQTDNTKTYFSDEIERMNLGR